MSLTICQTSGHILHIRPQVTWSSRGQGVYQLFSMSYHRLVLSLVTWISQCLLHTCGLLHHHFLNRNVIHMHLLNLAKVRVSWLSSAFYDTIISSKVQPYLWHGMTSRGWAASCLLLSSVTSNRRKNTLCGQKESQCISDKRRITQVKALASDKRRITGTNPLSGVLL